MEVLVDNSGEDAVKKNGINAKTSPGVSGDSVKKSSRFAKPTVSSANRVSASTRNAPASSSVSDSSSNRLRSSSTVSSASPASTRGLVRRNSIGDIQRRPGSASANAASPATSEGARPSRRASLPSSINLPEQKKPAVPSVTGTRQESLRKTASKSLASSPRGSSNSSSESSIKKLSPSPSTATKPRSSSLLSTSLSAGSGSFRKMPCSPLSATSPTVNSGSKARSSSSSVEKGSSATSARRNVSTPDSRDSRFIVLPQVETKVGDDVRLDLRGHRIRSLETGGLNLSPNLEVLDLSFNEFKGLAFEPLENCKFLQQLYLAGNQITSLATLPELPNLEFLSVAQNRLKSLAMSTQPRLQVLAASKNKIVTLKAFPHLPLLEHLRVEENPILEMAHVEAASILLVGPTLKKFNDRDLSPDEVELAKHYPPHTALCIRDGWEFCRPELAADSTFRFLFEQWKDHMPAGYELKEASVDQPFEEDACHCHFVFTKDRMLTTEFDLVLKYQWFIGDRTPTNFVPIEGAVQEVYWPKHEEVDRVLKIECTPILRETEYPPIFAISTPVSPGTGCPKVVNLRVEGDLVEGNVLRGIAEVAWCGGTPGKGVASWLRRKWNSSPVAIIGAEDEEYRLTLDDIGSSLVFMYTPVTEEGAKGEPQYAMTDFVKAAPPSVSDVRILEDAVEGNAIVGVGEYFGGKEGPSKFKWLRENKETGDFTVVSTGTVEYSLSKKDIGLRLMFVYIPINFEGQEGESASAVTDVVKQAPPRVSNLKIIGDVREGNKLSVSASVTGGTEGSSRVQWFKSSSSKLEDKISLEALSTSKIAKSFRIPLGAVGYYIVAKFTPMSPDGGSGEPAYAISEKAVETLPPSLNFLSVTGEYSEGEILTASYGYIGGQEGQSVYNWYLHENETDPGTLVFEASGLLQYHITKDAICKFVSFKCIPVRDDGMVGEPRISMGQERVRPGSPRLLSLQILGECIEGSTLHVEKKYWGGNEGQSIFRWYLTDSDGTQHEIKGATTCEYTLSSKDIGSLVSVSCEPVRNDWAHGPIVTSECIGPVLPGRPSCVSLEFHDEMIEGKRLTFIAAYSGGEKGDCIHEWFRLKDDGSKEKLGCDEFHDLTYEDVGGYIELVFIPIRKDGMQGKPKTIVSTLICPAEPVGLELIIPECFEDKEVVPVKSYFGGKEGHGEYTWYKSSRRLQETDIMGTPRANADVHIVGNKLTYVPRLNDVGAYLALHWVPARVDGRLGKPIVAVSKTPVSPALPVVSDVHVKEVSTGVYLGCGKYYGGFEGPSLFSWYKETTEGTMFLITDANSMTYEATDADYNCRLLFGYTPVRSDSVMGELLLSEPSNVVFPELIKLQKLVLTGKAIEGEVLTAVEVISESDAQQLVWNKYKKEVTYQWSFVSEVDGLLSYETLPLQCSSYKLRLEDIGRCLRCECIVIDVFGRSSEPLHAISDPIVAGVPKIDKLEIEGRGYHTNLYAVRGVYSGGREGNSRIQWLRSMVGSPDLISIQGEVGRMYEANVDDVGYRLVALYTPLREDGVEGQSVSASTEPIAVEPDVLKEVKDRLEMGAVKFEVLRDRDQSSKPETLAGGLERRILEVNRKRIKVMKPGSKTSFPATEIRGTYTPPFHVEIYRNDQHRLKIVVDSENEVDLMVQTRHMRDLIVLVIRGFAQRFNSTSLNSLLKIET
ncbi:187-kDa microtubule-associated protein AIR9 isoform X2 [Nymphaea colorata]|uniref:187-kDa microtubule-associated protein AIR9 isoform X2 n=1 Tax=Nymphaea colorata TaxID=210225 RepID=UPI00129D848A|nr:187-kDa microtubule-associated protein AIR9 isoform X2 [Nymphaea colorata]